MCGRFTLRDPHSHPYNLNQAVTGLAGQPRYNIAPSQPASICISFLRERPVARFPTAPALWHYPIRRRDGSVSNAINAKAETVHRLPSFAESFRSRRCLVVADGWYEWKPEGDRKQPYFFHLPGDKTFMFAGLYRERDEPFPRPEEGRYGLEFTIITTEPQPDLAFIHHRAPAVIEPKDWQAWLDHDADPETLRPLLKASAPGTFQAYPVSTYVNKPANDGPKAIEPLT